MIYEGGLPPLILFFTIGYIVVSRVSMTEVGTPQFTLLIQLLCEADLHGVTLFEVVQAQLQPSCHILSEVKNQVIALLVHLLYRHLLDHLHTGSHLSAQGSQRDGYTLCRTPATVIIAHFIPTRQFFAGIVDLTVILVVRADSTVGIQLPLIIGRYHLSLTILIEDDQSGTQFRITEVGNLIRFLLLLHGVVTAITQYHAKGILLAQERGYIIGIVHHGLTIIRRDGCQYLVADALTVDKCLVHTQSTDIQGGTVDLFVGSKLRTEITARQLTVLLFLIPWIGAIQSDPLSTPIGSIQQTDIKQGHITPLRLSLVGGYLNTPVTTGIRAQRFSCVSDPLRLIGIHGCVPQVTLQLRRFCQRRRDDQTVGCLLDITLCGLNLPTKARGGCIQTHRIDHALCTEFSDRYRWNLHFLGFCIDRQCHQQAQND